MPKVEREVIAAQSHTRASVLHKARISVDNVEMYIDGVIVERKGRL